MDLGEATSEFERFEGICPTFDRSQLGYAM